MSNNDIICTPRNKPQPRKEQELARALEEGHNSNSLQTQADSSTVAVAEILLPLEKLTNGNVLPVGVNKQQRELHLLPEDFQRAFGKKFMLIEITKGFLMSYASL